MSRERTLDARLAAVAQNLAAVQFRMSVEMEKTRRQLANLSPAVQQFAEALATAEAAEIAAHPDLAELDVRLDGYYGEHDDR